MKLFRGLNARFWTDVLEGAGWPKPAARRLVNFLTGGRLYVPRWQEIAGDLIAENERLQRELDRLEDMIGERGERD